jgi:hypothetical protein
MAVGTSAPAAGDKLQNVRVVCQTAQQKGVDPTTAVACMLVESDGNNAAVGDNGTSFGVFQLHQGGELGNLSPQQAQDPQTNADTALTEMAKTQQQTGLQGGHLAAAAQKPADKDGYAQKVDAKMPEAQQLIQQAGAGNGTAGGSALA